ncbi:UDP-N-acetylglucosamine--undecaprenyl-phosphate N-acetylglucosaminephosphotransferase [Shewanella profunda]|uniref:UDP-N-acetylglucosamine--undecaprenyl-phosphate N-acetylglucosaminephosphotransferase n=1 Tax=Shewanella profunda TaxID=254793 RepID=UPI00200C4D76|nr:UDP-N-acetylglucosamine--undecaprenyl-phosphate N-acetylglucosaminephosphotransferase [Shewanella profunda]MCL1090127.1 UDP-N-acetylglucosamine--undecaprenyl-phosphate N-acetylglucosaminephosphotransferase [Shewanella profunda]
MSANIAVLFVFFVSFISLFVFRKIAQRIGLVDKPNERKHHTGQIPLVGGISVFFTMMLILYLNSALLLAPKLYVGCALILVIIGAIDDRYDISFKLRLVIQAAVSIVMIVLGERSLHNLGYLMGSDAIRIPEVASYFLTVVAVIGAINAFNMVDGIDGLLGGLASVTFGGLGILFYLHGMHSFATFCGLLVTAMLPYIMLNLGFPFGKRFKVFMGDAGSIFIGFTVIWLLIVASQGERATAIRPVTALWLIALPLMDMVCIMIRRIRKGQSPFKPDREHLHHICQRLGMSSHVSLLVICTAAALMALVGIWSDLAKVDENIMFLAFLATFALYFTVMNNIWRITAFLRRDFNFTKPI